MLCPVCNRPSPTKAPCATCWRAMSPADKAPWIWRIRHEQDFVDVRHRDPVRLDAAPTLTAYIEWLESHFGGGL